MSELEEIRKRRMQELLQRQMQQQTQENVQQQLQEQQIEAQIRLIISKILTPEARQRLGNIRIARPDFARSVEIFLIQLYQAGRLPKQVDDKTFREILLKLKESKRDIRINK